MASPEVSVIIVSYNTRALLRRCLQSLPSTPAVEIIVVDNASTDDSAGMVVREFPGVRLVQSMVNRGFAAANNVALNLARGRFLLLLNPDAEVTPHTLDGLRDHLAGHGDAGICGPTVLFPDGSFQSRGFAFPTVMSELRQSRSVDWLLRRLERSETPAPAGSSPYDVDWVDGACLMIRREVVDAIGLLDEQYFLYGEEVDWCYRARAAGWRVVVVPLVTALHHRGQSTGGLPIATVAFLTETRLRFFRTHHGVGTALLVSALFVLGCLKQIVGHHVARLRGATDDTASRASRARLQAVCHWWMSLQSPVPPPPRPPTRNSWG